MSISIMLLFVGIIFSGLGDAKQRFLVRDSAQQFASTIRQTIVETKNGIKADANCVADPTVPRQCSNYLIETQADNNPLVKYTVDKDGTKHNVAVPDLNSGTEFEKNSPSQQSSLRFLFSPATFPLVSVSGAGVFSSNDAGTIAIKIKSKSNERFFANVCVYKSNTVLVQPGDCN